MDRLEQLDKLQEVNLERIEKCSDDRMKTILYKNLTSIILEKQVIYQQQLENLKRQIR